MTTVRFSNDEIRALEGYVHDYCARIDDRIHEHCKRIIETYENEVAAVDFVGYDVLGNERHKTALALKDCEFTYTKAEDNLEVLLVDGFGIRGSICYQEAFERLRDRLIYLLVGDQGNVKFSLEEDDDGVDTGRCDEADSDCPDAPAAERTGDCVGHPDTQGLAPITKELRDVAERYCNFKDDNIVKFNEEDFDCLCDAIDAIHAQLERDYQVACDVNERQDMQYVQLKAERDRLATALNCDDNKYPIWAPESHYMLLPKDKDGVPICVGDELEGYGYPNGGAYCKAIVGDWGILAGEQECNYQRWLLWSADDVRHHHAPTIEDVLREFGAGWHERMSGPETFDIADYVERYATKLRLAGDADE